MAIKIFAKSLKKGPRKEFGLFLRDFSLKCSVELLVLELHFECR